jgi:hypothetical protein
MFYYLITHGEDTRRQNPSHTTPGLLQFADSPMLKLLDRFKPKVQRMVVGWGRRFREAHQMVVTTAGWLQDVPVVYSVFCGTDTISSSSKGIFIFSDGETAPAKDCFGFEDLKIDWWKMHIMVHPESTVFFAGKQMMQALGSKEFNLCSLYLLDTSHKAIHCLVRRGHVCYGLHDSTG